MVPDYSGTHVPGLYRGEQAGRRVVRLRCSHRQPLHSESNDMPENKTQRTNASVKEFLDSIEDAGRRRDARALAALMRTATGERPAMWGSSIVGYGQASYQGRTGTADWFPVGFASRKAALVVYLMGGLKAHAELLAQLGPHKVGGGCLYLPRYADVDAKVLGRLIKLSYSGNRRTAKQTPSTLTRRQPSI